jgi:hypothetical protein
MVRWVIGLVVLSIVGWLVVGGRGDSASDPATETIVARGWDDLVPCSLVRSFDGGKVAEPRMLLVELAFACCRLVGLLGVGAVEHLAEGF